MRTKLTHPRRAVVVALLLFSFATLFRPAAAVASQTVRGVVINQTLGRSASGETVTLFRIGRSLTREARTQTDTNGAFKFDVADRSTRYLVRVHHQGVDYDIEGGDANPLVLAVYDSRTTVPNISCGVEVRRMGARGDFLHVSDMFQIRNTSDPAVTRTGHRTFEVFLPPEAKIDSVLASGQNNTGILVAASAVPGEPGHYAVNLPLRPGVTGFAFNYDVPYNGHAIFRTRTQYPVQQLTVMFPGTMKFTSTFNGFHTLPADESRYRIETAANINAGTGPEFEIAGAGSLPPVRSQQASRESSTSGPIISALASNRPMTHRPVVAAKTIVKTLDQNSRGIRTLLCVEVFGVASLLLLAWWKRRAHTRSKCT